MSVQIQVVQPCGAPTRQWRSTPDGPPWPCRLDAGHRGHHSIVVYVCDGCGQARRGTPHQSDPDSGIGLCFMCSRLPRPEETWE